MGITKFLSEVTADFEVLGERNDEWEPFKKNVDYEGFLVKRKKKYLLPLIQLKFYAMKITTELKKSKNSNC